MNRILVIALLSLCALHGQDPFDPEFKKDWVTSKQFTLAVAEAMPVDKYGFKVAPDEMAFAALMLHIATSQASRFAQIAGKPMPFEVPKTIPKDSAREFVTKLLAQSFDFCIAQLDAFTPEQLGRAYKVDWYERPEVTGRQIVLAMFTHTAHHRAQAEVYLRANGIKPPAYRF
jgi:uncharacterized damage-inducible protein DinB